jgi:P-type Ca2+ transporter type 2C
MDPAAAPVLTEDQQEPSPGLSSDEAARRLQAVGPNEIRRARATPAWRLLLAQFGSPLIWLLLAASVVAALLGEVADAVAIGAIVILNAAVGFYQEHRAEKAMLALQSMTAPRARLLRDGVQVLVPAATVVPGDVLLLEAGDIVAADARLQEAAVLRTNEAALTGESTPAEKSTRRAAPEAPLAERADTVFMGTSVAAGSGRAAVTATGMHTELGKIAHLLDTAQKTITPLQERLARMSRLLMFVCLGIVAVTGALGLLRGVAPLEVFLSAVSLAVAAVPEGLPAVVTIALALGVQRMARRQVLVRRLPAVETLGSATVICTDKTGTLTSGVMTLREIWGQDEQAVLEVACACCDADLGRDDQGGGSVGVGDPTELALLAAGAARGISRDRIEKERPRRQVNPFDAERKRMSILRADGVLYVKGAGDLLMPLCRAGVEGASDASADLARRGLRVLAIARGRGPEERDLELVGLVGLADPPRPEAVKAVAEARAAGIRTVMITGDHALTAGAIARELGIVAEGEDPREWVHARATPEDKLRLVKDWRARGAVVAMTGDGVNDAPALREAHIGIAMGRTGTEVTREAADMILADDNFASIVAAIREGRGIFDNIRKTVVYLLTGNAAELTVMFGAALLGWPLPLVPLHLLWVNLVTDGLPGLALVTDPPDRDVLSRPPRSPAEPLLGRSQWRRVLLTGVLEATVVLTLFGAAWRTEGLEVARSLAFTTLVFAELFRAFAARSDTLTFRQVGAFTNLPLVGVIVASVLLQLALLHIPAAAGLFSLAPLSWKALALALALGLIPVSTLELAKLLRGQRAIRQAA